MAPLATVALAGAAKAATKEVDDRFDSRIKFPHDDGLPDEVRDFEREKLGEMCTQK
jgi:hypothetical protein